MRSIFRSLGSNSQSRVADPHQTFRAQLRVKRFILYVMFFRPREPSDFQHSGATQQHGRYGMLQLFHVSWLKSTYHLIYAVLEQLSASYISLSDNIQGVISADGAASVLAYK